MCVANINKLVINIHNHAYDLASKPVYKLESS